MLKRDFPRYVWVTEFSFPDETQAINPCERQVRAHVVTDATGSRFWESTLIVDAPGIVVSWDFDPRGDDETARNSILFVENSSIYFPKIRGEDGFDNCQAHGSGSAD